MEIILSIAYNKEKTLNHNNEPIDNYILTNSYILNISVFPNFMY